MNCKNGFKHKIYENGFLFAYLHTLRSHYPDLRNRLGRGAGADPNSIRGSWGSNRDWSSPQQRPASTGRSGLVAGFLLFLDSIYICLIPTSAVARQNCRQLSRVLFWSGSLSKTWGNLWFLNLFARCNFGFVGIFFQNLAWFLCGFIGWCRCQMCDRWCNSSQWSGDVIQRGVKYL